MFPRTLALVLTLAALSPAAVAQTCWGTEQQTILPGDFDFEDYFGHDVDLDGDVLVVGSWGDDDVVSGAGAAYVFRESGGVWTQEQKLIDSLINNNAAFGSSVAVSGTRLVCGSPSDFPQGSAQAFEYVGTTWVTTERFTGIKGGTFGDSVDMDGDVMVVGGPSQYDPDDPTLRGGAVWVYRHDGNSWVEEQVLVGSDTATSDDFGTSVAVRGDRLIVGARRHDLTPGGDEGAAYVYRYNNGTNSWVEEAKLTDPGNTTGDWYGWSVGIDGNLCVVGAYNAVIGGTDLGVAVIHRDTTGTGNWTYETTLSSTTGGPLQNFGWSVAIEDCNVVVGAYLDRELALSTGAVYTYHYSGTGTTWVASQKLAASNLGSGDQLGYAVAIQAGRIVSGARLSDLQVGKGGAAYVHTMTELAMDVSPSSVNVGDPLTLTSCGAVPGSAGVLYALDVNAVVGPWLIFPIGFDGAGQWTLGANAPASLSGTIIGLATLGFYKPGSVSFSNRAELEIL